MRGACPAFDLDSVPRRPLTPVFFGSALRNFGVPNCWRPRSPGAAAAAAPGRAAAWSCRDEEKVTGFVFKVQANMDPNHRDRIAFTRLCSGRFHARHEAEARALGQDHGGLQSGVLPGPRPRAGGRGLSRRHPGHPQPRHICASATPCRRPRICSFIGIPSFAPEMLRRVRLDDPMKAKQLRKALEDLAEEGVSQVFKPIDGSTWIVGVVGPLQFDVLTTRIESEYNIKAGFEDAPVRHRPLGRGRRQSRLEVQRFAEARIQHGRGPRRRAGLPRAQHLATGPGPAGLPLDPLLGDARTALRVLSASAAPSRPLMPARKRSTSRRSVAASRCISSTPSRTSLAARSVSWIDEVTSVMF